MHVHLLTGESAASASGRRLAHLPLLLTQLTVNIPGLHTAGMTLPFVLMIILVERFLDLVLLSLGA